MNCPYCHNQVGHDDQFCAYCGHPLPDHGYGMKPGGYTSDQYGYGPSWSVSSSCPNCHRPVPPDAKRCPTCQTRLKKGHTGWIVFGSIAGVIALVAVVVLVLILTGVIDLKGEDNKKPAADSPVSEQASAHSVSGLPEEEPSGKEKKEQETQENPEGEEQSGQKEDASVSDQNQAADLGLYPDASASEYILPQSTQRLLLSSELESLSSRELLLARNEIYARHGRRFQDQEIQSYFDQKSWYQGSVEPEDFSESLLSEVEKKNIALILKEENSR